MIAFLADAGEREQKKDDCSLVQCNWSRNDEFGSGDDCDDDGNDVAGVA